MTLLATLNVQVDLPDGTTLIQAEGYVAAAIAWYFNQVNLPGNATATCNSLQAGSTVLNPTAPVTLSASSVAAASAVSQPVV